MALNAIELAGSIQIKMLAKGTGAVPGPALSGLCEAIAEAVVEHLQTKADVLPVAMVVGPSPVTGMGKIA